MIRGLATLFILCVCTTSSFAAAYTGTIDQLPECASPSWESYRWGAEGQTLFTCWTIFSPESEGYFYGTDLAISNCDVFVVESSTDPTSIEDVSVFEYDSGTVRASEGSTVLFRGETGCFGAWAIEDIHGGVLDGTWYFVCDGSTSFAGAQVPIERHSWGHVKARFDH